MKFIRFIEKLKTMIMDVPNLHWKTFKMAFCCSGSREENPSRILSMLPCKRAKASSPFNDIIPFMVCLKYISWILN